nr:hypothetical protein [Endozoicomonas sp.]
GRVDVPSPEVTDLPPAGSAQVATPEAYNEREFMNGVKIFNRNGRVCITANTINDCLEPGDQLSIWSTAQKGSGDGASVDELATGLFSGTPLDALYTVLESLDQRFRFPVAGANPIPENRNTMVEETSVSDLPRRHRHESVTACPHNASRSLSIDPTPGNITSTQAYLNSTLSIPEVTENVIVNNETRPIELTRDLLMLHNPASHIAPFDQYNPSITVTEQEYEYSRLVLGLLQLRFSEVEDYQLPFGFVPVLSDGHGNTAGIGYRAIPYAHVSVQDINDLAKEDPNVKKYGLVQKHKTLAHQLGETCYQASMWDKLLYPDVIMDNPVDGPTSTNTINQVIADCYRFIPRHGYQLAEPALTYQEVLTGECLNRECAVVIDLLQKVGVTTLTLPVLADKHANTEYYLQWEPFHGEEPDDAEPSRASIPAPDHSSSESLKASPYNSSGETLDVKKWRTVLLSDISDQEMDELTAVTPYLQDGSPCRFIAGNPPFTGMIRNNPLLLSAINNIVDLISSYSYQGAVPDLYQTLEKYLIDKQGGTIESKQLLKGFLSEFRHISKQQRSVVPLLDRHDLTGYLEILRTQTGIADLALSDKIWVGNKCNEPHLLIFYELREVCSGALSLYKGAELILPQQLERFRTEFVDKNLADKVLSFAFEEREPSDLSTPPPEPPQVIEVTTQNSPADSISTPPQFNLSENDQSGFDDLPANFEQLTSTGNTQQIDNTNHRVANAQTIPGPTIKTEQSQVTDIIENQPLLLLAINNIVDLIASFSYKTRIPDLIETLEKYLRVKQGTTLDSEQKLKAFISDFRQISEQQRRDVSLPPGDELAGYLEILLPESDRSGLTLSDTIWVSDKCSEMHLLIPYQLKKVFSGALSLYHRSNLILPHKLRWLRGFFVHEHFPEIMHEAYLRLAGTRGTLSNYLKKFKEYSLAERKPFTLTTIHQDQLRGYLNILQQDIIKTQCKTTTEGRDQLSLSDKIWFRMEINEVFTLIPFRLKEVFFGALSGRNAAKLILPPQLEKYRELITHEDFKDIIQDAYLGHCNIDSIKTNKAPRKFLRRCMHFNESLQDNPFILPAINQIVNRITEYKPDLMATVAQRLAAKGGTNAYTRNELNSYLLQFQDAAMKEKARQLASSIESGRIRTKTPDELAGYLTLLQPNLSIQPNSNQLALSDPIWLRSKVDGINLLIPYTLEEALIGSISEFDLEECIVPPELEQNIVYLTHQNGTEILHEAYKVDVLESIRSPIESLLNIMIYPILYVEKTFRRLADQAGVTSMNLTTIIGTYKDDNYYPPGVVGIVLDILEEEGKLGNVNTYAAYDLLLNTGRGINIDNYFFPSNQYSNDQNALTLFNLMINTDIENDFKSLISSLSSSSDAET